MPCKPVCTWKSVFDHLKSMFVREIPYPIFINGLSEWWGSKNSRRTQETVLDPCRLISWPTSGWQQFTMIVRWHAPSGNKSQQSYWVSLTSKGRARCDGAPPPSLFLWSYKKRIDLYKSPSLEKRIIFVKIELCLQGRGRCLLVSCKQHISWPLPHDHLGTMLPIYHVVPRPIWIHDYVRGWCLTVCARPQSRKT